MASAISTAIVLNLACCASKTVWCCIRWCAGISTNQYRGLYGWRMGAKMAGAKNRNRPDGKAGESGGGTGPVRVGPGASLPLVIVARFRRAGQS